jgi:glyoxylase-like metal-dependent hydrolase (beta-lactamase superfamily II)
MKILGTLLSVAILFALNLSAQQNPPAPVPSTVEKLRDDLYVLKGEGGNTTVLITEEGAILVDGKFERNHDDIVAKVRTLTDKPIRYVFNSHWHGDHSGGNAKLRAIGAQVVAHSNALASMVKGNVAPAGRATVTYTDQIALHLGGKEVIAYNFGSCHTNGDTFVYFPAQKVLAAGDCFNTGNGQGLNPNNRLTYSFYMDYNSGGNFVGREKTADALLKLDFDTVVPGHGPVTTRARFVEWRQEIQKIRDRMTAFMRQGRSKDEITKMLVDEFGWDPQGTAIRNSLDGMMAELK